MADHLTWFSKLWRKGMRKLLEWLSVVVSGRKAIRHIVVRPPNQEQLEFVTTVNLPKLGDFTKMVGGLYSLRFKWHRLDADRFEVTWVFEPEARTVAAVEDRTLLVEQSAEGLHLKRLLKEVIDQ